MREICTSGSVRGAARKSRPYRDHVRSVLGVGGVGGVVGVLGSVLLDGMFGMQLRGELFAKHLARLTPQLPPTSARAQQLLPNPASTPHFGEAHLDGGRAASCEPPPAQIRTCRFPASGSCLRE